MTISAFFMNNIFFSLNIAVRLLIIVAGLMIEFNMLDLSAFQHESIRWIGRVMIAFGIIRLAWLFYQRKHQQQSEDGRDSHE
jgi:hypothetical protein